MFSSANTPNSRSLDVGRGVAILSVMYGHALAPWFMEAGAHFSEPAYLIWKFGASFMMPFFFFMSGVAWRAERSLSVTLRQSVTLVLITLFASLAFDVVRVILTLTGADQVMGVTPVDSLGYIRHALKMTFLGSNYSMGALWFLTALGVARMMAAVISRAGVAATAVFAVLLLGVTFGSTAWGWVNFYQLNLIGVGFVFFVAGRAMRDLFIWAVSAPRWGAGALVVSGVAVATTFDLNRGCRWDLGHCGVGWLNGHFGVTMIHGEFGNLALFMFTATVGVVFTGTLSILIAKFSGPVGERLARWGRNSLNLLIVNCIFLQLLNPVLARFVVPGLPANSFTFFVALLAATIALNLATAQLLKHPLRELRSFASDVAVQIVNLARQFLKPVIVAAGMPRVSQAYAHGRAKRGTF
jgi:fucose 4-O-acetylase-like acetyltransferase